MENLTEREKRLLEAVKVMINVVTIWSLYENKVRELKDWTMEAMAKAGLTNDWQNDFLHFLENEYNIRYTKVNENGEEVKDDGDKEA